MRNKVIAVLVIVLVVLIAIKRIPSKKETITEKKRNFILICIDGLQAKHLKSYGYSLNTTPNLDNFLNQSTLFTKTVSPSSWTVPTHMSIFTSMYPSEHKVINKFSEYDMKTKKGVISNLKKLSPNVVTLAEILKNNGYVTGGFTGDAGVGPQFGFNQGFDAYFETESFGGFDGSVPKALEWLSQNKDKSFFLFLHGYDVHGQHEPNGGFDYRFVDKNYKGKYTGTKVEQGKLREEALANDGVLKLNDDDVSFWRAIYDEKINRMDVEFKNFMDKAGEMGALDNAVIVVISDHGTEFYEHKSIDHGATLYSELVNVLLAIHEPGQKEGKRVDQLVSTMDILPTVLDLLKIKNPIPEQTKGSNLSPALRGENVAHDVYSETDYRLYTFKRSLESTDGWKFILTMENNKKELYNLNEDPDELNNLVSENPLKAFELEQKLQDHIEAVAAKRTSQQLGCSPVYGDQCK